MATRNLAVLTKKIYESGLVFFSSKTLKDILVIENEVTFFRVINRLVCSGVLQKIEKNRYILKEGAFSNFGLANFLYLPSYISFESALNFHGLLAQFPYEITSATTKKTAEKTIEDKIFTYSHLQKKLFWGYEMKDTFLIADSQKALLDQLYLTGKGLKKINFDELDLSFIDKPRLKKYFHLFPKNKQFLRIWESLEKYL